MKRLSFLTGFFLLLASFISTAQTPTLKVSNKSYENDVHLQKLNIEVDIVGNFAVTTMTMTFKNKSSQILEGELLFPLPDGVTVSRYALDINGKMREAVPVEKAKATQVFEEIERRNVDPGILERVEGNNFRTRIYPFMPNASRIILISYEQELSFEDNNLQYRLPMDYKNAIGEFSLQVNVQRQEKSPVIKESPDNSIQFDKQGINYVTSFSRKNYQPKNRLTFAIPVTDEKPQIVMQSAESSFYFYVNKFMTAESKPKIWSNKIGIIWDVSLSGLQRDIEHELELLEELISKKQNLSIECASLSYTFEKIGTFEIKNGNWTSLKNKLLSLIYDGGTNYAAIDLSKLDGEEYLFFSDGLSTLSEANINTSKPVHCIVSSPKADYSNLKWIAAESKGKFINLNALTKNQASQLLMEDPLQFLGIKSNTSLKEVYPSVATPIQGNISICGISNSNNTNITLLFGYGNKVTHEETISLDGGKYKTTDMDVYRMWAQKKIAELDMRYDKHKSEIIELGQYFGIVTRGTSLMVLETLQDYIRYRIYPPEELRDAYDKAMKQEQERWKQQMSSLLQNAKNSAKDLQSWWNTAYKTPEPPKYPKPDNLNRINNIPTEQGNSGRTEIRRLQNTGSTGNIIIRGKVTEADGRTPIEFANVMLYQNDQLVIGTSSVQDGSYSLSLTNQGTYDLRVTYIGYNATRVNNLRLSADSITEINVLLRSANQTLEAIEINAERPLFEPGDATSSQRVSAEDLNKMPGKSMESVLSTMSGVTNSASGVSVRGNRPGTTSYVVDGGQTSTSSDSRGYSNSRQRTNSTATNPETASNLEKKESSQKASIIVADIKQDQDYLTSLSGDLEKDYEQYLKSRPEYISTPTFYFDMASWFYSKGHKEKALLILSNIADIDLENHSLFKTLAYKLKEYEAYEQEVFICKKIVDWRPMEPQSYRDYGLALADAGKYQEALDQLYSALIQNFAQSVSSISRGVEEILVTEINQLITLHNKNLNTNAIDKDIIVSMPIDIRVVLNWNMPNTDIDLHITDPTREMCYYSHKRTQIGGRISSDITQGYGPEQFLLKKAMSGKYKIEVNYFGDRQVKSAGPTTVMAEIYLYYADKKQERKIVTLHMTKQTRNTNGRVLVGEFSFE